MENIIQIENISELNKLLNQDKPKHPLISVVDFSTVDFKNKRNATFSLGFYCVMIKNLCPGALRYGRNY